MNLIGVEINDSNLKIILYKKFNKKINPYLYDIIDLEQNIIKNGYILQEHKLKSIIKDFINKVGIKSNKIVLNIQSTAIITRNIIAPKLKQKQLKSFIKFQIQDIFPIDISKYKFDYKINSISKINNQENYEITIIAVDIELIEEYINLFSSLNLNIINIDTNFNSLSSMFINKDFKSQTIGLIDIDKRISDFVILSQNKILFAKTILHGSDKIDMLTNEVNKFIDFYNSKNNIPISTIYIIGEKTYIEDIAKYIFSKFNINVISNIDTKEISTNNILFISLIGLIKKTNFKKFNLATNLYIKNLNRQKVRLNFMLKFILIPFIFSIIILIPYKTISFQQKFLANLNTKIYNPTFSQLLTTASILKQTQETIYSYNSILNNINISYFPNSFETIINCTPNFNYINSIDIDNINNSITIEGNIKTLDLLLEFIKNLKSIESYKNVNFSFDSTDEDNKISYTIKLDTIQKRVKDYD